MDQPVSGSVAGSLSVPTTDGRYVESIAADIRLGAAPGAWTAGGDVYAFSDSKLDLGLLACAIADAPAGTRIAIDEPDGRGGHFEIAG